MSFSVFDSKNSAKAGRLLSGSDFKRKSLKPAVVRGAVSVRYVGRVGSLHAVIVKPPKGHSRLQYFTEAEYEAFNMTRVPLQPHEL